MNKPINNNVKAPDFIGMGAPRSGTTWLYEVLRSHPDIWMPPIKELHYFDSLDNNMSYKRATHKQLYRIRKFAFWRFRHYLAAAIRLIYKGRIFRGDNVKIDFSWDCRFFGHGSNLEWYSSLFTEAISKGAVAGEFTPDYALIQPETAKLLLELNPNLKALLMFRDPIERTWSNAVFYVTRRLKLKISDVSDDDWIKYCFRAECLERSDYLRMYQTLVNVLPPEQIFVGYFDHVTECPEVLIDEICYFLKLPSNSILPSEKLSENINSAAKKYKNDIPKIITEKLFSHFHQGLEDLYLILGDEIIRKWIKKYTNN